MSHISSHSDSGNAADYIPTTLYPLVLYVHLHTKDQKHILDTPAIFSAHSPYKHSYQQTFLSYEPNLLLQQNFLARLQLSLLHINIHTR